MKQIKYFAWSFLLSVATATTAMANTNRPAEADAGNFWTLAPIYLKGAYGHDVSKYPKQVLRHVVLMKEADAIAKTNMRDEFARQEYLDSYISKGRQYIGEMLAKPKQDTLWMQTRMSFADFDFEAGVYPLQVSGFGRASEIESLFYTIAGTKQEIAASRALNEPLENSLYYAGKRYSSTQDFFKTEFKLNVIPKDMGIKMSREEAQAFKTKYGIGEPGNLSKHIFISILKHKGFDKNGDMVVEMDKVEFYPNQQAFDAGQVAATFTAL